VFVLGLLNTLRLVILMLAVLTVFKSKEEATEERSAGLSGICGNMVDSSPSISSMSFPSGHP
jgi:hypothetical protein